MSDLLAAIAERYWRDGACRLHLSIRLHSIAPANPCPGWPGIWRLSRRRGRRKRAPSPEKPDGAATVPLLVLIFLGNKHVDARRKCPVAGLDRDITLPADPVANEAGRRIADRGSLRPVQRGNVELLPLFWGYIIQGAAMPRMTAVQAAVRVLEKERHDRLRRAGGCDQPVLRGHARARRHPPHPGPPCRGRFAHGRRLQPGQARQYRRLHRHLGPGRHRHDHRPLRRDRRSRSRSCASPARRRAPSSQGGLPGDRHRIDRQAGDQVGGDRPRAGSGAARVPAGLPHHALGPAGAGADRPADRRADGRDRVRHRHLRAAAGLQAQGQPAPGREGDGDAERRPSAR